MSPIDSARIVDPELERRAGVVAAIVTLAEKIPIEQADRIVIAALQAVGLPVERVASSPQREHLLALLRPPHPLP